MTFLKLFIALAGLSLCFVVFIQLMMGCADGSRQYRRHLVRDIVLLCLGIAMFVIALVPSLSRALFGLY